MFKMKNDASAEVLRCQIMELRGMLTGAHMEIAAYKQAMERTPHNAVNADLAQALGNVIEWKRQAESTRQVTPRHCAHTPTFDRASAAPLHTRGRRALRAQGVTRRWACG